MTLVAPSSNPPQLARKTSRTMAIIITIVVTIIRRKMVAMAVGAVAITSMTSQEEVRVVEVGVTDIVALTPSLSHVLRIVVVLAHH